MEDEEISKKLDISLFETVRFLNGIYVDSISDDAVFKEENLSRMPDVAVESAEEQEVVKGMANELTLLERKILILKGLLTYE